MSSDSPDPRWRVETDPIALLQLLEGKLEEVDYRRCAAAWCQLVATLVRVDQYRNLLARLERVANGLENPAELEQLRRGRPGLRFPLTRAEQAFWEALYLPLQFSQRQEAEYHRHFLGNVSRAAAMAWAVERAGCSPPDVDIDHPWHISFNRVAADARVDQANAVRCVLGHVLHSTTLDPSWRTSTASALAQQMHNSRDFSIMPILGDALQDAGCESAEILDHCRGPGPHARGCWVVDLILSKS